MLDCTVSQGCTPTLATSQSAMKPTPLPALCTTTRRQSEQGRRPSCSSNCACRCAGKVETPLDPPRARACRRSPRSSLARSFSASARLCRSHRRYGAVWSRTCVASQRRRARPACPRSSRPRCVLISLPASHHGTELTSPSCAQCNLFNSISNRSSSLSSSRTSRTALVHPSSGSASSRSPSSSSSPCVTSLPAPPLHAPSSSHR